MNKLEIENKLKDSPVVRIPKEWEISTLGNLASYINGYAFKPEDWEESGLPIIRIEQLKNPDAKCDYFDKKLTDIYLINDGDLIFSWSATLFLKMWNRGIAYLNQHLYKVITKSVVKKIFLRYLIEFNIDKLYKETHGSTMQHITRPLLLKFKIILPPLHEQEKIAEILETVYETIEKTDAIIEKYKRIKQDLMQDLLTRGITVFEFEKDKLIHAVKKAFENGDHKFGREENLVSYLSRHLNEFFPEWNVDSEVEKNNDRQRPDIIIHKRRTDENLFAIEVKKNENLNAIKQDIKKLEDVMLGDYHYEDVVFIGFNIENFDDVFKLSEKVNFILVSKNGEIKVKPRVRRFKDSLLGKIPEEWEVVELGGLVEINPEKVNYSSIEFIRYIDIESIKDGKINNVKLFFKNDAPSRAQRLIRKNDVVVSTVRPNLKSFALVNKKFDGFVCSTGFAVLRAKEKELNSKYLLYLTFYDEIFLRQIIPMIVGSNYPAISSNDLNNILVLHPSLPEQHRIVSILSQIDETIEKEQNYKQKLERIKQGLMEDLLTGKVRVNHLIKEGVASV